MFERFQFSRGYLRRLILKGQYACEALAGATLLIVLLQQL